MSIIRFAQRLRWALPPLLVTACGGGFYEVSDKLHKTTENASDVTSGFEYATATIDLQNRDLFFQPIFTSKRDGSLAHLYVYASFTAVATGPKQIPLYLIDFDKHSVDETRGDELLSHYPINKDVRGIPLFTIETRALTKNTADQALGVWGVTKSFAQNMASLAVGPQTAPVFSALDQAATTLQSFSAPEWRYTAHIAIPRNYTKTEFADIYFILANDINGNILPDLQSELAKVMASTVTVVSNAGGTLVFSDAKQYTGLPYIIVDFTIQDYLSDPDLLSVGPHCAGVNASAVATSRAKLAQPGQLSTTQRELEQALTDEADAYLALKNAKAPVELVNAYEAWRQIESLSLPDSLTTTQAYIKKYESAHDLLVSCASTSVASFAGIDTVDLLFKFLAADIEFDNAPEAELEGDALQVASYLPTADDKSTAFLLTTHLYQRATARLFQINTSTYSRFYSNDIRILNAAKQADATDDQLADDLQHRYARTSCDKCRSDAVATVTKYLGLKGQQPAVVRANAVAVASSVAADLGVTEVRLKRANDNTSTEVTNAVLAIRAAEGVVTSLPSNHPKDAPSLDNLTKSVNRGLSVMSDK